MEKVILQNREITGKSNKKLLKEGKTPAVIYNAKGESTNIQLDTDIASKIAREATSTTILDVELDGKEMKAIVKDLDINPLTEQLRHISMFEIDESKEMLFNIPFILEGVSPAVKNNLGILVHVLPALELKGKLSDLVENITIDISTLELPGQTIGVDDITLPEGMTLVNSDLAKAAIVTITQVQKAEEVEETAEEGEEGEVAEGEEGAAEATTEEAAE